MKTILLIEDNRDIRENTFELLELNGYNVIVAVNGKDGLTMCKDSSPHIILCDIIMPEGDGYYVYNGLKDDPATANIPFVFLTANAEPKEIKMALAMGTTSYITKPFDAKVLLRTISDCLIASEK